jgi:heterodisulfide reductase subunit A-like polyferredoxin
MAQVDVVDSGSRNEVTHGEDESFGEKKPLKILIVGGGMAGLTAAIALRKQGHDIHVRDRISLSIKLAEILSGTL